SLNNATTLAQFPMTVMDLLGVKDHWMSENVMGEVKIQKPIVIREIKDGISYVRPNEVVNSDTLNTLPKRKFLDRTDNATEFFRLAQNQYDNKDPKICYHRANSIGKAIRGIFVAKCIEFDVIIKDSGIINVAHDAVNISSITL